jgi:nitrite reductase/ring-hydroxylating ferredoxin subunit/DMSO/TMAO reductase YedYZ heme-binding membrane subunit
VSVGYQAVGWNRQKRLYDAWFGAGIGVYLMLFVGFGATAPNSTLETLLIRGLGSLALLMLHVILSIGPLTRLDARFLPFLYNRRHLGVAMFLLAFAHASFAVVQFHAFGDEHPLVSVLTANRRYTSLPDFPFELLGLGALAILFLMAATSHDFWLANLSPRVWKTLHMLVYVAYALLIGHVALGTMQAESSSVLGVLLGLGCAWIVGVHLVAGWREGAGDRDAPAQNGWVDVGPALEIPERRARVVTIAGERVAVFRYDGKVAALSNVCRHQNGPLGEGRVIDGCVTCPWHGYQYRPEDGCSPPPFTEKVPTYAVRVVAGRVEVEARARPAGTPLTPALVEGVGKRLWDELYVGYLRRAPVDLALAVRRRAVCLLGLVVPVAVFVLVAGGEAPPARFEYGAPVELTGTVMARPYPHLIVQRPGTIGASSPVSSYSLVAPWKFGADELVAPFDGQNVHLSATLAYRDGIVVAEVVPGSLRADPSPGPSAQPTISLGQRTLVGEIVDSKCFFGVMNPGELKTHRACAVRCISGGIPPVLCVRGLHGGASYFLLVSAAGEPVNQQVLDLVAEPVEITGEVQRSGDNLVLRADPVSYRRLE